MERAIEAYLADLDILAHINNSISGSPAKDEVCNMNDAQKAAKQFGTIIYEITTTLSAEIAKFVI